MASDASLIDAIRRVFRWFGLHELADIVALCLAALAGLVFIGLWDEIRQGESMAVDRFLLLSFRSPEDLAHPIGPSWLVDTVRDVTSLGSVSILALTTIAAAGYLALGRKPHAAALLVVAVVGAGALASGVKAVVARPRPDVVPHLVVVHSPSFPSGHSMVSAAVYLTIGTILARFEDNLVMKSYIIGWAALISFMVGLSRVYLGVHWPSDVLGGWAAGAGWAALCWIIARVLQRRGEVEPSAGAGSAR